MKTNLMKLMLALGLMIAGLGAQAQVKQFEKYSDVKDVQYVFISKAMLQMAGNMAAPKVPGLNMKGTSNKLTAMQIITSEKAETSAKLKSDAIRIAKEDKYDILMQVDDESDKVRIYFHEGKNQSALLMLIEEEEGVTVIVFSGNFKQKDIEALANKAKSK